MPDREDIDDDYFRQFEASMKDLRSFAVSNFEYFKTYDDVNSLRFVRSCSFLLDHIDHGILPGVEYVLRIARFYDFSELHPANGFRSLVKLVDKGCTHLITLMRFITSSRKSLLFRGDYYSRELESYVQMLGQLRACLYYAEKYISCSSGCDLISENINDEQFEIMEDLDNLSLEPFYGTCLGFHLCPSLLQPLTLMHIILASYSESYNKPSVLLKFASTLVNSGKFIISPEFRAKRVIDATLEGDVAFCKSFWSLSENILLQNLQKVVCPQLDVNRVFHIPPDPILVTRVDDPTRGITVMPSTCHGDAAPVMVRLLSYVAREGQVPSHTHPPSDCLIIHIHGGGFVAQSSASHSLYLRYWAKELDIPILSIDYSLAPEFPYPRQVEEIFLAYCWALNNSASLGSTGKKICLVGDSAGANLAVSTALRAVHRGVRPPDGVLSIYGSFHVRYAPSPSRLMAILDPILPLGLLIKCLSAYIGVSGQKCVTRTEEGRADPEAESQKLPLPGTNNQLVQSNPIEEEDLTAPSVDPVSSPEEELNRDPISAGDVVELSDDLVRDDEPLESEEHKVSKSSSEGDNRATSIDYGNNGSSRWNFSDIRRKITEKKRHSLWKLQLGAMNNSSNDPQPEGIRSEPSSIFDFKNWDILSTPSKKVVGRRAGPGNLPFKKGSKKKTFDPPEYALYRSTPPPEYHHVRSATERNTDPFLSPVFASSALLGKLCPAYFIACHFDPLLDESVHLAKRIRSSGGQASLDLVDDLPHGFLNFIHMSKEANLASALCVSRMKEIFGTNGDEGDDEQGTAAEARTAPETHCEDDDLAIPSSYGTFINDDVTVP